MRESIRRLMCWTITWYPMRLVQPVLYGKHFHTPGQADAPGFERGGFSENVVAVDKRYSWYSLCALNLGKSKIPIFKFSMFVSYTWQYFANSHVLCFLFMCICCSTMSEKKKADKVVKVIEKLQNKNMENYFKPF